MVPPSVREAQELLVAAYPELREGNWRGGSSRRRPGPPSKRVGRDRRSTPRPPVALVVATLLVDEQGRVQELACDRRADRSGA